MIWGMSLFCDLCGARGWWECQFNLFQWKTGDFLVKAGGVGYNPLLLLPAQGGFHSTLLQWPVAAIADIFLISSVQFCLPAGRACRDLCVAFLKGSLSGECWRYKIVLRDYFSSLERILCASESSYKIWQFEVISIWAGVEAPSVLLLFCGGGNTFIENVQICLR